MVKILVCGDFHGTFPKKLERVIKKEKIDFVISNGDYLPFFYRKLWFKHCFGKEIDLSEVIGKKKYLSLLKEDLRRAEISIKKLNALPIPVFTVLGNIDYPCPDDTTDFKERKDLAVLNWDEKREFAKMLAKYRNITRFDYSFVKFKDYILVGMRGHSSPGFPKSKAFKKHQTILERLFKRFSKENKDGKVIFVSHNMAYKTKLDKIGMKAHKAVRGKHAGSKLARNIINKFHPTIFIGGHIHEAKGTQKLGNTLMINPGSAHEGNYAILDLDEKKSKKVKLY